MPYLPLTGRITGSDVFWFEENFFSKKLSSVEDSIKSIDRLIKNKTPLREIRKDYNGQLSLL